MTESEEKALEGRAKQILSRLSAYAKEHNLSNARIAKEVGVPYNTLSKWWFFSQGQGARKPSEPHIVKVDEFLISKEDPELYRQIQEARRKAEKIKYLLILLEDELRWFRDNKSRMREEFRRELDPSDIGYISSLLTMLSEEDKFQRWRALTTIRFQSFRNKRK